MSYDLYFHARPAPSADDFVEYFSERPKYKVSATRARYENADTGVYFSFDFVHDRDQSVHGVEGAPAELDKRWASFELNYYRPSVFALEAAPELEAFVERFGSGVRDPQVDGMGESFSTEGFLRAWTQGNRFAVSAIHSDAGVPAPSTRAKAELQSIWRWNIDRQRLQADVGACVFVPKIVFLSAHGTLQSASVWPDAITAVLPKTDCVLVVRDRLTPDRTSNPEPQRFVVPWHEVEIHLRRCRVEQEPVAHHVLDYDEPPEHTVKWVRELSSPVPFKVVRMDQVLDAELAGV